MQAQDDPELERLKEKIKQQQDRIVELLNYILQLERELQTGEIQMTLVKGTTHQGINVRSSAQVASNNIVKAITAGIAFEGELITGLDGKQWIQLSKLGGVSVVGQFIAAWVVNSEIVNPTPTPPLFPQSFTLTDPSGAKAEYTFVRVL